MLITTETTRSIAQANLVDQPNALRLIADLCAALRINEIDYCHWKSNAALDRSASGENDLDLLISRADAARFTALLYQFGFKAAQVPAHKQVPGILDFYGYDTPSGKLVHVHAHYQLVLGDDMTKNYRLPIEQAYLESATQGKLFRVPAPEFELIVLVIRSMLKHSTGSALLSGHAAIPKSMQSELDFLQAQANRSVVHAILQQHLPFIAADLFDRCLKSVQRDQPLLDRIRAGRELHHRLAAHARRAPASDIALKFSRRAAGLIQSQILHVPTRRRLICGGAVIAVIGGDGAGKSTMVKELKVWCAKAEVSLSDGLAEGARALLAR